MILKNQSDAPTIVKNGPQAGEMILWGPSVPLALLVPHKAFDPFIGISIHFFQRFGLKEKRFDADGKILIQRIMTAFSH